MAVVAPIPSASAATVAAVNAGARRSVRAPKRRSRASASSSAPARTSRTSSFTRSTPPTSTSAARRAASELIPARTFSSASMSTYERSSSSSSRSARARRKMFRKRPMLVCLIEKERLNHRGHRGRGGLPFRRHSRARGNDGPPRFNSEVRRSRGLQRERDRECHAPPLGGLGVELPPAGLRERVVLRAAVVLRLAPPGGEPPRLLHPVEGGEEGAGLHDVGPAGDLLDPARDAEAVHFAERERLEDQQVEGALQQRSLVAWHGSPIDVRYEKRVARIERR